MNVRKIAVRRKIDSDLAEKAAGILTVVADGVTLKRRDEEMEIFLVFTDDEVIDLTEEDAFRIFLESGEEEEEEEGKELIFEDERDKGKAEEESVQTGKKRKERGRRRDRGKSKKEIKGKKERKREIKGRAEDEVAEAEATEAAEAAEAVKDGNGWLRKGHYAYRIKDGFVEARYKGHRLKLPYETVKSIFDEMPDEATVNDVLDAASKLGVQLGRVKAYLIARAFTHVLFDATVTGGGERRRELKIIKPDPFSLSSEARNKMRQELEVIGKGL